MERLGAFGVVLAFVSLCHTSTQKGVTVVVDDGRVGVGLITGGTFGPGSFSVGGSGSGRPTHTHVYENEHVDDGEHIITLNPSHPENRPPQHDSSEPHNSRGGNTQLYPVKPQTTHTISVQGGMGSEDSNGGNHIYIDTVILNNNTKENKSKNNNSQPVVTDASAILGSNDGNTGCTGAEKGLSNTNAHKNIQISSITGGNIADGTGSLKNNNRPDHNVPQKGVAVNNENTRNPNDTRNEALYSIGHGANNAAAGNAGDGYNGQINSGHDSESSEEPWIWSK